MKSTTLVFGAVLAAAFTCIAAMHMTANADEGVSGASAMTSADMQELAPYMNPDINNAVREELGETGTTEEWLEAYVELDPSFNEVLMDEFGFEVAAGCQ